MDNIEYAKQIEVLKSQIDSIKVEKLGAKETGIVFYAYSSVDVYQHV
jgi:hypothetical protein